MLERLDYDRDKSPELNYDYFGILDEILTLDDTLLLVIVEKGALRTPRSIFRMAESLLASQSIGDETFEELLNKTARYEGGVPGAPRRWIKTTPQNDSSE